MKAVILPFIVGLLLFAVISFRLRYSAPKEPARTLFLYSAGFFGGLLQLYNLSDRGLSLRMLIDILESPRGGMTTGDVAANYGAGCGIAWMYGKRLEGIAYAGLAEMHEKKMVLTARGRKLARLFAFLQNFARVDAPGASL